MTLRYIVEIGINYKEVFVKSRIGDSGNFIEQIMISITGAKMLKE